MLNHETTSFSDSLSGVPVYFSSIKSPCVLTIFVRLLADSNPTPTYNTSEHVAHCKSEEHGEGGGVAPSAQARPTLSTSQQHLQTENEKCYFCRHLSDHRGKAEAYTPPKYAPITAETHFEMQTADWPPHESLEYPAPKDHTLSSCGRSRSWPSAVQSWLPLQRGVINVRDATSRAKYRQTREAATATPSASAAAGLPGGNLTTPRSYCFYKRLRRPISSLSVFNSVQLQQQSFHVWHFLDKVDSSSR